MLFFSCLYSFVSCESLCLFFSNMCAFPQINKTCPGFYCKIKKYLCVRNIVHYFCYFPFYLPALFCNKSISVDFCFLVKKLTICLKSRLFERGVLRIYQNSCFTQKTQNICKSLLKMVSALIFY